MFELLDFVPRILGCSLGEVAGVESFIELDIAVVTDAIEAAVVLEALEKTVVVKEGRGDAVSVVIIEDVEEAAITVEEADEAAITEEVVEVSVTDAVDVPIKFDHVEVVGTAADVVDTVVDGIDEGIDEETGPPTNSMTLPLLIPAKYVNKFDPTRKNEVGNNGKLY